MRNRMRPAPRAAFTIVELLVVIAIIGVIASLSIGAVFTLRESQTKNFAEANVQKLASALEQQWKAVLDQAHDDSVPLWAMQQANNDRRRARVIFLKARLRQEFPVDIQQARSATYSLPAKQTYASAFGGGLPANYDPPWASSAVLYMVLTQSRRGMAAAAPDTLVDGSAIQSATAPNGRTYSFFVDGWGNPLRYYVFPTDNDELNDGTYVPLPATIGRDVQDPEDTLMSTSWPNIPFRNNFEAQIHDLRLAGQPARYLVPVVASAGKDGKWGIDPYSMRIAVQDEQADNIYSYRLRRFGARGD